MKKLNVKEIALYDKAVAVCKKLTVAQLAVVDVMLELDQTQLYKSYGYRSLYLFSIEELKLSDHETYTFTGVSRKCAQVPALYEAIKSNRINVARARRIISVLNNENAETFIRFAETLTSEQLDFEVAKLRPEKDKRPDVKPVSGEKVRVSITVSKEVYEQMRRVQSLMAQNGHKELDLAVNVAHVYNDYLNRHDPVRKSQRAQKRNAKKAVENDMGVAKEMAGEDEKVEVKETLVVHQKAAVKETVVVHQKLVVDKTAIVHQKTVNQLEATARSGEVPQHQVPRQAVPQHQVPYQQMAHQELLLQEAPEPESYPKTSPHPQTLPQAQSDRELEKTVCRRVTRVPLTAEQKHSVFAKTNGRCTFTDRKGLRCQNDRYTHIHHIHPVSMGGSNDPSNLTLLCSFHHDLVHQLSFPLDYQVNWVRAPATTYSLRKNSA